MDNETLPIIFRGAPAVTPPYCRTLCGSVLAGLPFRDDDAEEESDVQRNQEDGDDRHERRNPMEETMRGAYRLRNFLTSGQCARMPRRICDCRRRLRGGHGDAMTRPPSGSRSLRAAAGAWGGAIETKEPKNQRNLDIPATLKIQIG
jgi:hypothetical protein